MTVVQVSPRCRIVGRFAVRGRAGANVVRFDRRLQGRRLPAGTYQLRFQASGTAPRRVTVVISDSARLSSAAIAAARQRSVCSAEQAQVLGAQVQGGAGLVQPGSAAGGAPGTASEPGAANGSGSATRSNPSQNAASRSGSEGEPDEGGGIGSFAPGRLADEIPGNPLGTLLLVVAVLLLTLAALPRVAIPDPRLSRLLVARRIEVAAVGATLFFVLVLVAGLA